MKRKHLIIGLGFFLLFGSELRAQQTGNHARLSGRAVRSYRTPGLSSVRRTRLNNQVINSVVKQNTPTKAGQSQIKAIEWRLRLRAPATVEIRNGKRWPYGWGTKDGKYWYIQNIWIWYRWANWFPR